MSTARTQGVKTCQQVQQRQSPASHMLRATMSPDNEYAPIVERIAEGYEVMNDGRTRLGLPEGTHFYLVQCESIHFQSYYYVVVFSPARQKFICTCSDERTSRRVIAKVECFIAQEVA